MKNLSTLFKGLCCLLLIGSTANADLAFNIDPVRASPDAPAATYNDFVTQNPDSGLDPAGGTFFNLVGDGNFTEFNTSIQVAGGLDIAGGPGVAGGYNVIYTFDTDAGEADGEVAFSSGSNAHNDLDPITEGFSNNASGTITITGLLANSEANDTITLTIYGIGDNIGFDTTFEAAFAGSIQTDSTIYNAPGEARDSAVGSVPFVDFTFTADGVTDVISFDAIAGSHLNGFSVGITPAAVPEPTSMALVCLGGLALIGRRRR